MKAKVPVYSHQAEAGDGALYHVPAGEASRMVAAGEARTMGARGIRLLQVERGVGPVPSGLTMADVERHLQCRERSEADKVYWWPRVGLAAVRHAQ